MRHRARRERFDAGAPISNVLAAAAMKRQGANDVAKKVAKVKTKAKARSDSVGAKPANPLLTRWGGAFGLPPFKRIEPKHFNAAFAEALKEHKAEIARIAAETGKPTP